MNGELGIGRSLSMAACAMAVTASFGSEPTVRSENDQAVKLIESYCSASWRNARIARQDWNDCTQETFVELLNRVSRNRIIEAVLNAKSRERRELNRSIWCVAQRWRRVRRHHSMNADEVADMRLLPSSPGISRADVREIISRESSGLTRRQQKVLAAWLDGATIAEIAVDQNISCARVSDDKYKALQKLRVQLKMG